MSNNLSHKMFNTEITPPASAWEKIATELDKLEHPVFVNKVLAASIDPPADVWQNVEHSINRSASKTFRLNAPWMKWAAAAILVGLISIPAFYVFNSINSSQSISKNDISGKGLKRAGLVRSQLSPSVDSAYIPSRIAAISNPRLNFNFKQNDVRNSIVIETPVRHAMIESFEAQRTISRPAEQEAKISNNLPESAPNFIPPPNYYVVSAPNGERVRISSKFSGAVTSLFPGDNSDIHWKMRFDSWKSKLMSNPSFIPAAGNFLDIAEFKDLLKEQ